MPAGSKNTGGAVMAKYLMLGKYSPEGIKGINKKRTEQAVKVIRKGGGKVVSMLALLGSYDLALVVEFPGTEEVMRASVALTKLTGIGFFTYPAFTIQEFDKIVS
jgi:uncharacterized protein with GYD domain